mgnify:CR=1 FL=1|tara:strand:+ start:1438 stop:1593 length:156 start_codon:yes stop_codon:yes gene_type:complete
MSILKAGYFIDELDHLIKSIDSDAALHVLYEQNLLFKANEFTEYYSISLTL